MNGRMGNDRGIGKFTCVTENGCSVVDYVLCRPELMHFFNSFVVLEPNILSVHCAINFSFGKLKHIDDVADDDTSQHIEYTYKWNADGKEEFIQSLRSDVIQDRLNSIANDLQFIESQTDIDSNLSTFYEIIDDACSPTLKKYIDTSQYSNNYVHTETKSQNRWFDSECIAQQEQFYNFLHEFRREKSEYNRKNMVKSRSAYKQLIRRKRYQYDKKHTQKLENARFKNAKEYWKLLKGSSHNKRSSLHVTHFEEYFRAINNPDSHFFQPDDDILEFNERYLRLNNKIESLIVITKGCNICYMT